MKTQNFLGLNVTDIARTLKMAYDRHVELERLRIASDVILAAYRKRTDGVAEINIRALERLAEARGTTL